MTGKARTEKASGFSLVEVLIALTVLSIGLLGLASLQGLSVMSSNRAYLQSQAVLVAQEIVDRMRANPDRVLANEYAISLEEFPAGAADCSASCTPDQLAQFDLAQWKCSLGRFDQQAFCRTAGIEGLLPDGDGQVVLSEQDQITVTVFWSNGGSDQRSVELTMQP